jgi:hypothetical protein
VGVRALGTEVQVCAPPDEEFTDLLARGQKLMPQDPVRPRRC